MTDFAELFYSESGISDSNFERLGHKMLQL